MQASFGCFQLTTIGATYLAAPSVPARALALPCTSTESIPKSPEKTPGALFVPVTLIVSFGMYVVEMTTFPPVTPPPFLFA